VTEDSSLRLEAAVNAVIRTAVSVTLEHLTPYISVQIKVRVLIIDSGSNISILQTSLSKSEVRLTHMRP